MVVFLSVTYWYAQVIGMRPKSSTDPYSLWGSLGRQPPLLQVHRGNGHLLVIIIVNGCLASLRSDLLRGVAWQMLKL